MCFFPVMFVVFWLRRRHDERHLLPAVAVAVAVALNLCALLLADIWFLPTVLRMHLETARRVASFFGFMYLAAGAWCVARYGWLAWQRRRGGRLAAAGQACVAIVLCAWLASQSGLYTISDIQDSRQSALLLKWHLPYVMLLTLLLPRRYGLAVAVWCGVLVAGSVAWQGLVGVVAVVAAAAAGAWLVARRWPRHAVTAGLALGIAMAAVASARSTDDDGWIDLPGKERTGPLAELTEWMRQATPVRSLFLVPPQERGIRVYGERSLFVTNKDGGPAIYSREFAERWLERLWFVRQYSQMREDDFGVIAKRYGIDYAVTLRGHSLDFPPVFNNSRYVVYDLKSVFAEDESQGGSHQQEREQDPE